MHEDSLTAPGGTVDASASRVDGMFAQFYPELRRIAHQRLGLERHDHTLSTTALVNEAWIKLSAQDADRIGNREQFFALAARSMRRILVDYARRHHSLKRGGHERRVSLSALDVAPNGGESERGELVLAIEDALTALEAADARLARVVEYRFYLGMTEAETAELLGVTSRTVSRDWVRARAWLISRLDRHSNGNTA